MLASNRYQSALRTAWLAYLVMLLLPFPLLAVVLYVHFVLHTASEHANVANRWFLLTMAYLSVAVPAALVYRKHLCSAYYRGELVTPRNYLVAMITVWLSLEVGMILGVVGCGVTESLLPCLFPTALAFGFFMTLWPTGRMMISRVGNQSDAAIYEEPR
jgi:hypothetical protein